MRAAGPGNNTPVSLSVGVASSAPATSQKNNEKKAMGYRHVVAARFGGPEVLEVIDEQLLPEPGAGEVRVKVLAAGTGFTDTIIRRGNYVDIKTKPPFTLGYDYVGIVDKLGSGVSSALVPGQLVADMPGIGGYTQYIIRPVQMLVPVPDGIDPVEAVCMPLSFLTAYQMLIRIKKFTRGQRILIHGASGAAGTALLVLGQYFGLEMYGTCSHSKFALLEQYGCTPIDYKNEDFVARIKTLTENQEGEAGVDAVFDAIGGAYWQRSFNCLRRGGILVGYGAQNIAKNDDSLPQVLLGFLKLMVLWNILPNGRSSTFYNILSRRKQKPQEFNEDLSALFELLKQGKIKPIVAATYPLAAAQQVHRQIDAGEIQGKVVLLPFAE
jgi:NADPH:quinone reductase-like Zn-dependent oxidoreductase